MIVTLEDLSWLLDKIHTSFLHYKQYSSRIKLTAPNNTFSTSRTFFYHTTQ